MHSSSNRMMTTNVLPLLAVLFMLTATVWKVESFASPKPSPCARVSSYRTISVGLLAAKETKEGDVEEYRNAATKVLSLFMQNEEKGPNTDGSKDDDMKESPSLSGIDFEAPKLKGLTMPLLAAALDYELTKKEWFVTGQVNPVYFSDDFLFEDPDVKLAGIKAYAQGVNKLFDQETSRAEIISTVVNPDQPNTITCTWRLSGGVNIGPAGLKIKPYIVFTDFTVALETGLIVKQEDRFDLPQWDILLSSLFPFLIGKLTAEPAPPVAPRSDLRMPKLPNQKNSSPSFGFLQSFLDGNRKQ